MTYGPTRVPGDRRMAEGMLNESGSHRGFCTGVLNRGFVGAFRGFTGFFEEVPASVSTPAYALTAPPSLSYSDSL